MNWILDVLTELWSNPPRELRRSRLFAGLMATLTVGVLLTPSWRDAVVSWQVDQIMERLDPPIGREDTPDHPGANAIPRR